MKGYDAYLFAAAERDAERLDDGLEGHEPDCEPIACKGCDAERCSCMPFECPVCARSTAQQMAIDAAEDERGWF